MTESEYRFTLYIAGRTKMSDDLVVKLEEGINQISKNGFFMDVIDVLEAPEQAARADVFVTPTLIRNLPKPVCRVIGNLKDTEKVISAMKLTGGTDTEKSP